MPQRLSLLLVGLLPCAMANSGCSGLGCSLDGTLLWRFDAEGDEFIALQLNISAETEEAVGEITLGYVTEPVNASLQFSTRGRREALMTWPGATGSANWSALLVGSDPNHVWLHGAGGLMAELTRAPLDDELAAVAEAADSDSNETKPTTKAVAAIETPSAGGGLQSDLAIGTLHRFRSLAAPADACLVAALDDPTPRFGACGSEDALWEVVKGRSPALRSLMHHPTGLCLQRRCYTDSAAPLRLGKCGQCGTARWKLEGGSLASQAVTSSKKHYCVGRAPPEAVAEAAASADGPAAVEGDTTSVADDVASTDDGAASGGNSSEASADAGADAGAPSAAAAAPSKPRWGDEVEEESEWKEVKSKRRSPRTKVEQQQQQQPAVAARDAMRTSE